LVRSSAPERGKLSYSGASAVGRTPVPIPCPRSSRLGGRGSGHDRRVGMPTGAPRPLSPDLCIPGPRSTEGPPSRHPEER
jgi:hypothetical protein